MIQKSWAKQVGWKGELKKQIQLFQLFFQVFLGGALLSSKITQEPPSPRRLGKGQWFPSSNLKSISRYFE